MQALRWHKWAFAIIVLLLIGIMVGRNLATAQEYYNNLKP